MLLRRARKVSRASTRARVRVWDTHLEAAHVTLERSAKQRLTTNAFAAGAPQLRSEGAVALLRSLA